MILELKNDKKDRIHLHQNILNILFENKIYLKNLFSNVIGLFEVSYVSITIINPDEEAIIFSSMPSIQYNLISKGLWSHDNQRLMLKKKGLLVWWDEFHHFDDISDQVMNIKKVKNNLTLGMDILRDAAEGFYVIYSFATSNKGENLKDHYLLNHNNLLSVGNYCFKLIRELYEYYYPHYKLPKLGVHAPWKKSHPNSPYLELVVNNSN